MTVKEAYESAMSNFEKLIEKCKANGRDYSEVEEAKAKAERMYSEFLADK